MKLAILLTILLILIGGCSVQDSPTVKTISGTKELILNDPELQQLGMTNDLDEQVLQQLGIDGNGTNCHTEGDYSNIVDSSLGQYSVCAYLIPNLNNTQLVIQLQKFSDYEALNGSYQYDSSHLRSVEGIISENNYGDQSRFSVNHEKDYGGQFNTPGMYYYHLWFTKGLYLVHLTSSGTSKEAEASIANIGTQILSKFG